MSARESREEGLLALLRVVREKAIECAQESADTSEWRDMVDCVDSNIAWMQARQIERREAQASPRGFRGQDGGRMSYESAELFRCARCDETFEASAFFDPARHDCIPPVVAVPAIRCEDCRRTVAPEDRDIHDALAHAGKDAAA